MRRAGLYVVALALGALLWVPANLRAQATATISGTVKDTTGAVIPSAKVTITNQGTGAARAASTNASGYYTVADMDVGVYSVSGSAKGFKTNVHTGIDVHVGDQKVVDLVLQVGEMVQTVEVKGGAAQVQLRSGAASTLISPTQMAELPLNGGNFLQLALLVPGASPGDGLDTRNTGLLSGSDVSFSGASADTNAWLVDGANNVDEGSGRTLLIYPAVDAIQEFKVQRNSMDASNVGAGGAIISVVTKSGTNHFHGSAYEFVRNTKFDANDFFLNRAGAPRPKRRYNEFGFTVGGPIKKDKLFFFYSEQWRRDIRGIARMATVPTLAERQGNFSPTARIGCSGVGVTDCLTDNLSVPTDPYDIGANGQVNAQPFPGNQIPTCASGQATDCLSKEGLAFLQLFPAPTNLNTNDNWVQGVTTSIRTREDSIRTDYNVNDHTTMMFRFTNDQWNNPAPNGGSENGLWGDDGFPTVDSTWGQPSKSLAWQLTQTFGSSKVNQIGFTYSNNRIYVTQGLGKGINDAINAAIPTVFPHSGEYSHTIFWGAPGIGAAPTGGIWNEAPWVNGEDLLTWKDDFTWTTGNHSYKIGGLFNRDVKTEPIFGASQLAPEFWGPTAVPGTAGDCTKGKCANPNGWGPATAPGNGGQVTGNGLADWLLAGAYWGESGEAAAMPTSFIHWHDTEAYFADTWRIRPRLTLTYGVRWVHYPPTFQFDDHMGNFVPSLYDASLGATATNGMIYAPGFVDKALGITGGSANLRGFHVGRGLRYNDWDNFGPRFGFAWDPTGAGLWAIRGSAGIFYGRADNSNPDDSLEGNPPFSAFATCGSGRPLDSLPPVSSGLCGTGVGIPSYAADLNWKVQGSYQWNMTVERQLAQNTKLELSYIGNKGVHLPVRYNLNQTPIKDFSEFQLLSLNGDNSRYDLQPLNSLESPVGNQGATFPYQTQGGNSIYNAFQLYLTKQFSKGYQFGVSYAIGKTLANTTQDCCQGSSLSVNENVNYDRGLSDFDRTQILTVNWIYDTPALNGRNRFYRGALGSWESTGVYSFASGLPLRVTGGVGGCPASSCRPDFLGHIMPRTPDQWFSPLDYGTPTRLGDIGGASPANLRGPGINNFDLAIYKNFPLRWEGTALQFRFETFNTLNHTQLLNVDTGFSPSSISLVTSPTGATSIGCIENGVNVAPYCNTNGTFGRPRNARAARELQFALKFIF